MKKVVALVPFALIVTAIGLGQPRGIMRGMDLERGAPFLFHEAVSLISSDSSLTRLDILYRIDQNYFVAVRNQDASIASPFICRGQILIELFDSLEVSKARSIQDIQIGTDRSEREPPGSKWYKGLASFEVPPGKYKIVFDIDDLESERRYLDEHTIVHLKRVSPASVETSTPLFVDATTADSIKIIPIGFGPNLLFGRNAAIFVELPIASMAVGKVSASYTIFTGSEPQQSRSAEPPTVVLRDSLITPRLLPHINLSPLGGDDNDSYRVSSIDSSEASGVIVPLQSARLALRRFELRLKVDVDGRTFTATKKFQMVWPDMPASLRDVNRAIDVLKYITSEDQRDSIKDGSFEQRRDKLEDFWKGKDKTPETAYNEVMVEYYRRVDYATKTFGTLHNPDGFKTDRGKVYILYGSPSRTERTLDPSSGYQEVWTYEKSGKTFVFADQSKTGNYVLVSTQSP